MHQNNLYFCLKESFFNYFNLGKMLLADMSDVSTGSKHSLSDVGAYGNPRPWDYKACIMIFKFPLITGNVKTVVVSLPA